MHLNQDLDYTLLPHETLAVFIDDLSMRGIVNHSDLLILLSKHFESSLNLQAGHYIIKPGLNLQELIKHLAKHQVHYYPITVLNGWTFLNLMQHLRANPYLSQDTYFKNGIDLMKQLSGKKQSPEGRFLPQTYFVTLDSSEYEFLNCAYQAMQLALKKAWQSRAKNLPLKNSDQALILASLVEEEAKEQAQMVLIASVFYNRLRSDMPLQSDPTVMYAVNKPYGSHLSRQDLRSSSPFNTYTHKGLPPTAIGLPSLEALEAVLHPSQSSYYYFEAQGQGKLRFSKNLREQEQAILRYNGAS